MHTCIHAHMHMHIHRCQERTTHHGTTHHGTTYYVVQEDRNIRDCFFTINPTPPKLDHSAEWEPFKVRRVSSAMVSSAMVSGAMVSGAIVSGAMVSGDMVSGAIVSGAIVSGAMVSIDCVLMVLIAY